MTHSDRIRRFQTLMETAMHELEDWPVPIEIHNDVSTMFTAWSHLHSETLRAYYSAKAHDDGLQSILVPADQAIAAQKFAYDQQEKGRY